MSHRHSDYDITEAMITFGGGFVSALGRLFRLADPDNQDRLLRAFPEYWQEYDALATEAGLHGGTTRTQNTL